MTDEKITITAEAPKGGTSVSSAYYPSDWKPVARKRRTPWQLVHDVWHVLRNRDWREDA